VTAHVGDELRQYYAPITVIGHARYQERVDKKPDETYEDEIRADLQNSRTRPSKIESVSTYEPEEQPK
jgi:hypothetical protein